MTRLSELSRKSSASETSQMEDSEEEARVRKFSKRMLKGTMFVGSFKEKRFVQPLNAYRDVIQISSDEDKFIENLMAVKKRCSKFYDRNTWIGITDPRTVGAPAGFNLWVTLSEEVFGSYWYTVKRISFHKNEIALKLEIGKPFNEKDNYQENFVNTCKTSKTTAAVQSDTWEFLRILDSPDLRLYLRSKLRILFTEVINVSNVKDALIFICLLLSTLMTFAVEAFKYLLDYSLKFLHEISGVITACTPITLGFLRVVMNTILGLYTLIAYMWRSRKDPGPTYRRQSNIMPIQYNTPKALTYQESSYFNNRPNKSYKYGSVVITPMDE